MKINLFELAKLSHKQRKTLLERTGVNINDLVEKVTPILRDVAEHGDLAVAKYTKLFDGADMAASSFRVKQNELDKACELLPADLIDAMEVSIRNIKKFHEKQKEVADWEIEISPGIRAGEKSVPLASVGLYIPRGKGSFPSMMMMAGVPAKVAEVERIVVVTPPDKLGRPDPATIAAARMIGIDEIYAIGGVQAIGALAYGTQTIRAVDKIVGPGSGYVLAAKQVLSTLLDTGLPAGPSEAVILADNTTDPELAVTDLLIEAEHGPDSSAYLVCTDLDWLKKAREIIPKFVNRLPAERKSYCEAVLSTNGGLIYAADIAEAADFINDFAPEHLQILTPDPQEAFKLIKYAGEVLLGNFTPGTLANYSIGPNAILPTSRFARTSSALSVSDFTRRMSYSLVDEEGFKSLAPKTLVLAQYEGFAAHANALLYRLGRKK